MRLQMITVLAILLYNAGLAAVVWWWEWPVGIIFVFLLAEIAVLGFYQLLEVVRAGAELGRPLRALVVGLLNGAVILVVGAVAAGFAAYYSWITGTELRTEYLMWPLAGLAGRYCIELVVSLFLPEPYVPSILLHRIWLRVLSIALGILACGVPLLLWVMSTFPFELPNPGDRLFHLTPYVQGLEPLVMREVAAATLTLLVVIKLGFETHAVWVGNRQRAAGQWGWIDRLLGVKNPTGPTG